MSEQTFGADGGREPVNIQTNARDPDSESSVYSFAQSAMFNHFTKTLVGTFGCCWTSVFLRRRSVVSLAMICGHGSDS